jgi:hypothetical protein
MCSQNGAVLGWPVPAEIDHLKTRLVLLSDVCCNFATKILNWQKNT